MAAQTNFIDIATIWLHAGKGGKPAKAPDARSARRESSRALREAVQGRSARSRDAGAGEATPEMCIRDRQGSAPARRCGAFSGTQDV